MAARRLAAGVAFGAGVALCAALTALASPNRADVRSCGGFPGQDCPGLIVPARSIRGVSLSMPKAQVRRVLGAPLKIEKRNSDLGPYERWTYSRLEIVFLGRETVTSLRTTNPGDRTGSNVGVGSTRARVLAAYPGVNCDGATCDLGKWEIGKRLTAFGLKGDRVSSIEVFIYID